MQASKQSNKISLSGEQVSPFKYLRALRFIYRSKEYKIINGVGYLLYFNKVRENCRSFADANGRDRSRTVSDDVPMM